MEERYRHELKYYINRADYLAIRSRIRTVMKMDPHARSDGTYQIRSIYFDNPEDKALREKVDGIARREKWRIRYYNDDFSHLTLEKKIKCANLCLKHAAPLTEEECRRLLAGDRQWMISHPSGLIRELYCKMRTEGLFPRVLVSYEREPYIYPAGNVRITFDDHIRTSLFQREFLTEEVADISASDAPQDMVLEVKYDDYLPEIIGMLLQTGTLRQQSFSKYEACRRYG